MYGAMNGNVGKKKGGGGKVEPICDANIGGVGIAFGAADVDGTPAC